MVRDVRPTDALPLGGQTAIVSGASSGIGLETVRQLADAGARVHALARREAEIIKGVGEDRIEHRDIVPHAVDVSDRQVVSRVVAEIGAHDNINILICNAGTNVTNRRLEELTPDTWDSMIAVNLSGAFYLLHAALPFLRMTRGIVVMISSVSASWPDISGPAYQASKAGMLALARAAGLEEHERGIRVTTIMPGLVDTPILEKRPTPPDQHTLDRSLKPEDIARVCLFVVTLPSHSYIPELTILPTELQALGHTWTPGPPS